MSREFKNVLVALVSQDKAVDNPTAALTMGLALARMASAFVTVNYLSPRPDRTPFSLFSDDMAEVIAKEGAGLDASAHACLAAATVAADAADVPSSTEVLALEFIALVHRSSQLAQMQDVVVMDARSGALEGYSEFIQGMLFRSGRPVVLVPEGWGQGVPRTVSIAWDGSVQATRAVTEALPILQNAAKVDLVSVTDEKNVVDASLRGRLNVYLDRHGVQASEVTLTTRGGKAADALCHHVASSGSEMIVMGAYGHSRIREFVLGGVTRSLLGSSPVPLFLCH